MKKNSAPERPLSLSLRPELAFGPNPLIEAASEFVPYSAWSRKLRRYPLEESAVDWKSLSAECREPLLEQRTRHFVPHTELLEPAADLQKLFRSGLANLNPLQSSERLRHLGTLASKNLGALKKFAISAPVGGGGGIWDGITATGRTALARRVLEIIAPQQVLTLDKPAGCEAMRITVLCYLYVDFPTNGSRGGLLKRILERMDDALGTSYSDDLRRVTNLDVLFVEVCKKLSSVRCVLLVIDEKQGANFEDSPWQVEFVLFYMLLMNLGINVLLIGNPLAFVHLKLFSQVMRRFSVAGQHSFVPAMSQSEEWWATDLTLRIRKFNVVEVWDIDPARRGAIEFENAGGLTGLLASLQSEVQLVALRRSGSAMSVIVHESDYDHAVNSPRFKEQKRIALSIAGNGDGDVPAYLDLPLHPRQITAESSSQEPKNSLSRLSEPTLAFVKRLLARYTRETTTGARKVVSTLESLKGLDADDLRLLGVSSDHLEEMRKMLGEIGASGEEGEKKPKRPSKKAGHKSEGKVG